MPRYQEAIHVGSIKIDIVDNETRSRMMSSIKGKNTQPEILLRKYLHANGFRFRIHVAGLPGKPDIVLAKYRLCIFVHGCFWHRHEGCKLAAMPHTNLEFWEKKFAANKKRDEEVNVKLRNLGWRVFVIWECGIREHHNDALQWLPMCIKGNITMLSWPQIGL